MNKLPVSNLTPDDFAPFGVIGMPTGDGGHAAGDVPLDLSQAGRDFTSCVSSNGAWPSIGWPGTSG
jgi:hypothetical protein